MAAYEKSTTGRGGVRGDDAGRARREQRTHTGEEQSADRPFSRHNTSLCIDVSRITSYVPYARSKSSAPSVASPRDAARAARWMVSAPGGTVSSVSLVAVESAGLCTAGVQGIMSCPNVRDRAETASRRLGAAAPAPPPSPRASATRPCAACSRRKRRWWRGCAQSRRCGARQPCAGGGVGVGQVPERAARGAGLGAAQPALLRGELGEGHRATRRGVVFILVQGGARAPVERGGARGVEPVEGRGTRRSSCVSSTRLERPLSDRDAAV